MDPIAHLPLDDTEAVQDRDFSENPKEEDWKSSLELEAPPEVDPTLWKQWGEWETLPANDFIHMFKAGMKGENIGLGNGLNNVNKYIYGTHRARYYLEGADSGVGKTTISDFKYILKGYEEAKRLKKKFKVFYLSFEIGKPDKIGRWISYYIFTKFGLRLPSDYILGRIEGNLVTKAHEKLVMRAYADVMKMMECISFVDHMIHPTKIFEDLITSHYENEGIVERAPISEEDAKKGKKGFIKGYKAKNGSSMTILIVDHMALAAHESGLDTKGTMDKLSKYMVVLRNLFGTTCVAIQQFSTDMMSASRTMQVKKTEAMLMPSRLDFGDSKATYRDADVVHAYMRPGQHIEDFFGYNTRKAREGGLADCMVVNYLLKNRYGPANRMLPLFVDGCTGYVYDLPLDSSDAVMNDWYNRAIEIENICQTYCPRSV
jgi:hypothetical protein